MARSLNNQTIKYKVQSGDSLTNLASQYNISIADLAKANNLSVTSNLLIGQTITIQVVVQSRQVVLHQVAILLPTLLAPRAVLLAQRRTIPALIK